MGRLEDAIELLDLGDWLGQYAHLRSAGDTEVRLQSCPKCGNDKFKLYVNTEKKVWICYVCDWGRGLKDVTQLMASCSGRTATDVRIELIRTVIPTPAGDLTGLINAAFDQDHSPAAPFEGLVEIEVPGAAKFDGITTSRVRDYALSRGLTPADVLHYKLRAAASLELKGKKIVGPFLVFPVSCSGKTVSWQGRRVGGGDPKYISNTNVKNWLWPLNPDFFARYETTRQVYLVEGVFDALAMLRLGLGAVCTFGKSISDNQLTLLGEMQPKEVMFAWDLDATREVQRALDRVSYRFPRTFAVTFKQPEGAKKLDAGDALVRPELADWIMESIDQRIDVRSPEFFQWKILNL